MKAKEGADYKVYRNGSTIDSGVKYADGSQVKALDSKTKSYILIDSPTNGNGSNGTASTTVEKPLE